jgi:hypothetical protein
VTDGMAGAGVLDTGVAAGIATLWSTPVMVPLFFDA